MDKSEINGLLVKYLSGTSTSEENAMLETWYMNYVDKSLDGLADQAKIDQLERIRMKMLNHSAKPKTLRLWPKLAPNWIPGIAIAAAVTAIALCVYFFNANRHTAASVERTLAKQDIAPGRNGATITLANGKVIQLSDQKTGVVISDELKYSDGSVVRDSSGVHSLATAELQGADGKVQNLTASTSRGQTYQFTLPDGTKVWLNAESSIGFPSQFNGRERKIVLSGEAYFAVVHNAKQPFRVASKGQIVEDIGTEFNINAYTDEGDIRTTLVAGSAKVNEVLLKPNQQAVLSPSGGGGAARGGSIKVLAIDAEDATAWKNGLFIFEDEPLQSIMKKVSRWYDVEVVFQQGVDQGQLYGGSVSRYDKVSKVLEGLELTKGIHFKIEGRRITVMQ